MIELTVRGHTRSQPPESERSIEVRLCVVWLLGWATIWAAANGRLGRLTAFSNFGLLWLALAFSSIVQGILLGGPDRISWIFNVGAFLFGMVFTAIAWVFVDNLAPVSWWARGLRLSLRR